MGGYPGQVRTGGYPSLVRVPPSTDGVPPVQRWGTSHPEMGYPSPSRDGDGVHTPLVQGWGAPPGIEQKMEYLIRSGRTFLLPIMFKRYIYVIVWKLQVY